MNAVIYCRVSSKDQVDGTSLDSQELACREYAAAHGMHVIRVFIEEGESAKFADRTQLLELLAFCRQRTHQIEALLVWKIDRFARNVEDHYTIKAALKKMGVRIVSVTEPIQADPSGQLLETILAGFAQFDNDVRALRTIQGMQQRIKEGIWPWHPPLGYIPPKVGKKTHPDRPDPRTFEPLKKAWRLFATGAYRKSDIRRLLQTWGVVAYRGQAVTAQTLDCIFANPFYAGVLRDPWSKQEHRGVHVSMVTQDDFARVQEIIGRRSRTQPHYRLHDAFPVRGHVRCPTCQIPMTGYFAKGQFKRYPYYRCFGRSCPTRNKSYPATAVHTEFSQLLVDSAVPHYLAKDIIRELISAYSDATDQTRLTTARLNREIETVNCQLRELISMRAAKLVTDDEFILQSEQLRKEQMRLKSRATDLQFSFTEDELGQLASSLSNLEATWSSLPPLEKRAFSELLLPAGYVFQQVRTAEKGLLFRTFDHQTDVQSSVVPLAEESSNTIIGEIRRFLAILQHSKDTKEDPKDKVRKL